jgi:nitroreductase
LTSIERRPLGAGEGREPLTPEAATLSKLLAERYSCRAYRPEPVPRAVIEQMLQIAQMAPSWCNSQPWQVTVTEGVATERFRKALFERAREDMERGEPSQDESDFPFPDAYTGVYKERRREVGWQLYDSVGVPFGDRVASAKQTLENFRLFGAPHMLLVTSERDLGAYGAIDCGVYVGALVLAAQSLGIGMIPQAALAMYAKLMHEFFDIPDSRMIVLGASFGYPDPDHPANAFRSRRAALGDAVTWLAD